MQLPAPTASAAPPSPPAGVAGHRAGVWRYLRALGASAEEADDLAQEVMVVACGGAVPSEAERVAPFLRGVARNQWLRTRRWWRRRREREVAAAVDELWTTACAHDDGEELLARLRGCLDELQPRVRTALELHYRDGLGWQDIAPRLGLKLNGTKTLVQRARQALRICIERRHP